MNHHVHAPRAARGDKRQPEKSGNAFQSLRTRLAAIGSAGALFAGPVQGITPEEAKRVEIVCPIKVFQVTPSSPELKLLPAAIQERVMNAGGRHIIVDYREYAQHMSALAQESGKTLTFSIQSRQQNEKKWSTLSPENYDTGILVHAHKHTPAAPGNPGPDGTFRVITTKKINEVHSDEALGEKVYLPFSPRLRPDR